MLKKIIFVTAICFGLVCCMQQNVNAQQENKKEKQEKKVLERPNPTGASQVDAYVKKAFDTYDESVNISAAIEFIKVEVKPVPDKGDGVTTEVKISNGKGEALSKENALKQLAELLIRAMKQNDNIKSLGEMKKGATEEVKTLPMMQKPKASKALAKGGEAEAYAIGETKTQIDLINQQIATLKAIKNN